MLKVFCAIVLILLSFVLPTQQYTEPSTDMGIRVAIVVGGIMTVFLIRCLACSIRKYILFDTRLQGNDNFGDNISTDTSNSRSSSQQVILSADMNKGMIDCKTGTSQINKNLFLMGIPGTTETTFKKRKGEIFQPVFRTAQDSFQEERMSVSNETPYKGVAFKHDMCWQKCGSGRSYNNPSGMGTVIRQYTGKVLNFDKCIDHCAVCKSVENGKCEPKELICQDNCSERFRVIDSSTSDFLVQSIENKSDKTVDTQIIDDGASTLSKVEEIFTRDVENWKDIHHAENSFSNALYALKPKHTTLTTEIIQYYQRCFSYAIQKNKNNENQLKQALSAITPHSFGNHDKCESWCKSGDDNFCYTSLPHGKCLSGVNLKLDIERVFNTVIYNVHRLATVGSTIDVESTNSMHATNTQKKVSYRTSEGLSTIADATVSQKNFGCDYIKHVNAKAGLLQNKVTSTFAKQVSKERKRNLTYSQQPQVKKMCLDIGTSKRRTDDKENKEGITFKSGTSTSLQLMTEAKQTPDIKSRPQLAAVDNFTGNFIIFDLETTSLKSDCEILQIAAASMSSSATFDCYIQPTSAIPTTTSVVTGLTNNGGVLLYRGRPVDVLITEAAFQNFVLWLSEYKPVLLISHNAKNFDSRRLIHNISKYSCYGEFKACVEGFVDTLPMFKEYMKGLESYTQENLYKKLCSSDYNAHNAVDDVASLKRLIKSADIGNNSLIAYSFSLKSLLDQIRFDKEVKVSLRSFDDLIKRNCLSSEMALKIAQSGLRRCHLEMAFSRNGLQGLIELLSQKRLDNSPRVTKTYSIIKKISEFFDDRN